MDYFSESILKTPLDPRRCLRKQIMERIIQVRETLRPGTEICLPTSRTLAALFKICHGTVHIAYERLKQQGVIIAKGRKGTYLLPVDEQYTQKINPFNHVHEEPSAYFRLSRALPPNQHVAILEMPSEANLGTLTDRMHKAMYSKARRKLAGKSSDVLLAEQILAKLQKSGLYAELSNIFIPGRGNALRAVAAATLKSGDLVVMESDQDTYPQAIFRSLGCDIAFTEQEEGGGMNMNALESICRSREVRLVFIRPDSSWPLGTATGDKKRDQLIALSKTYNFRIIAYEYESEYATVNLPPRLSTKQHEGRVIFVSVISRVSRICEQSEYVVAGADLIQVLQENDTLIEGPRCRSFDQILVVMHQNGSLCTEANKLIRGHEKRLRTIERYLANKFRQRATVVKPECGRFIVIQFHKPIHVKHLASLSDNLNLNYYERNKHLKPDQTVTCLRIEYTVFEKAEWEVLVKELIKIL